MKFYDDMATLHLETYASRVGLGAGLPQTREDISCSRDEAPDNSILAPIAFAYKSLSGMAKRCSNIEREAICILCSLDKFHHYCCAKGRYNQYP